LELGNQNPPTAQRTVTGSGCVFVTDFGQGPYISACTTGRVVDFEQKDPYDMGTAMAPAAFDTILAHFKATQTDFSDYDAVFTGDLAAIGHEIVTRMFEDQKIKVRNYYDCGCMMYDKGKQYVNAGGSGAGCSATVLCADILKRMRRKELKKILFVPTGALLSTTSQLQSQPIPSIAHAVVIQI
jgi:stage V sporulation protein AD